MKLKFRTCVTPNGQFVYGIHSPRFNATNLRAHDYLTTLGTFEDGRPHGNDKNFPAGDVEEPQADRIFEIPNAFPFRGATFIGKKWADSTAVDPFSMRLPDPAQTSLSTSLQTWAKENHLPTEKTANLFKYMPHSLLLALATTSTDPNDLVHLAEMSCPFAHNNQNKPVGLRYKKDDQGRARPVITDKALFEALANNIHLPDEYKEVMVLRPGAQGESEIVGEWEDPENQCHIFEYLRRNSYIPWGHYAANMANDSIRYQIKDLTMADMTGMRHLYYQRTFTRMAEQLGLPAPVPKKTASKQELEELRTEIIKMLHKKKNPGLSFNATLWGWNYGFDYAPSRYRLHASHQQIHQQFAMLPAKVPAFSGSNEEAIPGYGCGDLIASFLDEYRDQTGKKFFDNYIQAIRSNTRFDGRTDREHSLIVYEDQHVMLFVPKAQTSQWELQLMTLHPAGNILETDSSTRAALDRAMLIAVKTLTALGARMITSIEFSKRFDSPDTGQRLLYCFLPKLPQSPGAFSEAQLRWIMGHYPEDFAVACRAKLPEIIKVIA